MGAIVFMSDETYPRLCTQSASWHVLYVPIQIEKLILYRTIFYALQLLGKKETDYPIAFDLECAYISSEGLCA
jgi:hypothetical protein